MNNKPAQLTIKVRPYAGTYAATCKEAKVRASCTASGQWAAESCAIKVYGQGNFLITFDGKSTYTATPKTVEP